MAETLRELVVSLSLQSDNFSKNIKSVQSQIKEAESRFQAAGAGVENFGNKTDGMAAKAGMLTDKLRMQGQITQQYEKALNAANATLQKNMQTQQNNKAKLDAAKKSQGELNKEIERAKVALSSAEKAYGKNSAVANNAREALADLQEQYAAASKEVKDLEGKVEAQNKTLQRNADQVTNLETALNKAKAAEAATKAELDKTNRAIENHKAKWEAAAKSLNKFGDTAKTAGQNLSKAGQLLTASITAPLVALGGYAVKASIDAESAFAGVRKTVDMTEEEFARLDKTIAQMSTTKPAAYSDVAALAETGGQLGIANENLEMFVSTMTDLGVATNLVGSEGAAQLAKFANITGMSQGNFDRLGATIVDLGNNMATTEADIMAMSMRLGAAGSQVGLSESQILAFSAALSSVGIEAEAGGSAFSKAMIGMELAVVTGKNGLKDYAKVAGMSSAEFQKAWKDDAAGAIQAFIVGLSNMSDEGVSTIKVLDDMGFTEVRLRDTLMRATNASGLFANAQKISSGAWKANTALANEASKRYATTESRMTMLKNRASALARTFGDDLSPAFGDIIDRAGEWIDNLAEMDAGQRQTILTTAAWLAAIGPGIMLIGKMNTGIGNLATGLGGLVDASVKAGGGLKGLFAATSSLLGPAGIAVLAGAAIYGAWKWYDYASGAKAAREATEAMIKTAKEWQATQAQTIYDTGNDPFARFGVDKADFAGSIEESKDWMGRLVATWTDGKSETNQIVKEYVDEFTAGTDEIRQAIEARKEAQGKLGASDPANDEYLAQLKEMDAEVAALLKKRQNGFLTEDEIARLNEVIEMRADIELKYTTVEGSGYDTILKGVEAEIARIEAEHGTVGVDLYADALKAGAQGQQAQVDALNASYREQYAVVQSITDDKQKQIALDTLNKQHQEALNAARKDYNDLVAGLAPDTFQTEEMQAAKDSVEELAREIAKVQADKVVTNDELVALRKFAETLDEGQLASYLAYIGQLKDAGLGDIDLGGGILASDLFGGYDTLAEFVQGHAGDFGGLSDMFGAASDEAMRVLVDMGLTEGGQTLKDWLDAQHTVTVSDIKVRDGLTVADIPATGDMYSVTLGEGVTVEDVIATGKVASAYVVPGTNADGTANAEGQMVLVKLAEGATVEDVAATGIIVKAAPADGLLADINTNASITQYTVSVEKPVPVTATAELDLSTIDDKAVENYYREHPNATKPTVPLEVGIEFGADWKSDLETAWAENKVKLYDGKGMPIEVGPEVPVEKMIGPDSIFVGREEDGTYHIVVVPQLGTSGHFDLTEDAFDDSTRSYLWQEFSTKDMVGEVQKAIDAYEELQEILAEDYGGDMEAMLKDFWTPEGTVFENRLATIQNAFGDLNPEELQRAAEMYESAKAALASGTLTEEQAAQAQAIVDDLQSLIDFAQQYDIADAFIEKMGGVGDDAAAGMGGGMAGHDFTDDANTTAGNLETALRDETGSHSPATKFIPIGQNIVAGVVKGVEDDTYKLEGAMVRMARDAVAAAKKELVIKSPSRVLRDEVGVMMARGIGEGVLSGGKDQERIIANAARQMADAAVGGASYDNRRTYHNQNTVSLAGANIYVRDDQDIRALAIEIAALTKRQQRGAGMRLA